MRRYMLLPAGNKIYSYLYQQNAPPNFFGVIQKNRKDCQAGLDYKPVV